jgi:hypothetical protein
MKTQTIPPKNDAGPVRLFLSALFSAFFIWK